MIRRRAGLILGALAGLMAVMITALWLATIRPVLLTGETLVTIPAGVGAAGAADILAEAGVVRSSLGFRLQAAWDGADHRLQAGEYVFRGRLTVEAVVQRLVAGEVLLHSVTVPEGLNLWQTAKLLNAAGLEITGDLQDAMGKTELIADLDDQADNLEGYLFPDTYQLARGTSAESLVEIMVQRFREVSSELLRAEGRTVPLRSWVTLASLVEKETGVSSERSRVAGVFNNRLQRGMLLQCDPTVIYALEREGIPLDGSLASWLSLEHPYNTYRTPGLPPGPIANPGRAALAAALAPPAEEALYFVADGSGGHRFSRTLAEHNEAVRQWRRYRARQSRP